MNVAKLELFINIQSSVKQTTVDLTWVRRTCQQKSKHSKRQQTLASSSSLVRTSCRFLDLQNVIIFFYFISFIYIFIIQ